MAWAAEMVRQSVFDFIRISFMIDLLSAKIAQAYNRCDVVNTDHLKEVLHAMLRLLFIMVR